MLRKGKNASHSRWAMVVGETDRSVWKRRRSGNEGGTVASDPRYGKCPLLGMTVLSVPHAPISASQRPSASLPNRDRSGCLTRYTFASLCLPFCFLVGYGCDLPQFCKQAHKRKYYYKQASNTHIMVGDNASQGLAKA